MDIDISPEARELKSLLFAEGVTDLINMRVDEADDGPEDYIKLQIMSASTDKLGPILASLQRADEFEDTRSLSRRITNVNRPGHWQYGLILTRYGDRSLVFQVNVLLPAGDLPEVISRLRG